MPYKPTEVESMLVAKLKMSPENKDHRVFKLEVDGLPPIRTKVSHNNKDIKDKLENRIHKQLRIRKPFFHALMDCKKYRDDYIKQVKEDPYPPLDQLFV